MTSGRPQSIDVHLKRTEQDQADASDPNLSVWVSANAGTGKTHVLTMRVLRLLLTGTAPEKILCLTYTKAAAAEMSKRVFDELGKWVVMPEAGLEAALRKLTGQAPNRQTLAFARTLFTTAIETPGGLKVQTIHAFSERLLQRFPLEAGIAPGFKILDDDEARTLRAEAIGSVLTSATRDPHSRLASALQTVAAYAGETSFDEILEETLKHRNWLKYASQMEPQDHRKRLCLHFGVRPAVSLQHLETEIGGLLTTGNLKDFYGALLEGSANDVKLAPIVNLALDEHTRRDGLEALFLTKEGTLRKSLMTAKVKKAHPELETLLSRAQDRYLSLATELHGREIIEATLALTCLSEAVMQNLSRAKDRRGALDFQDLIDRTASLLSSPQGAEWVLYKLDNGLDHLLVDESQDTAPDQWQIIHSLTNDFFSGLGTSDRPRSIFAVGDEKQSIYSFQGAAPEMFAAMGERFETRVRLSGQAWKPVPLNLSFRTVAPVLAAVDSVFADHGRAPGLSSSGAPVRHFAKRMEQSGLVEIWPLEAHQDLKDSDPWSPLDEETQPTPVVRLACRIARTIKSWLDTGDKITSENRPIRAGDILILVRKRRPFASPMVGALKALDIPVAGSDRIQLSEQIAVMDLMALGDFLTLPEDDLSLAAVLKSPIFGLDDDDLITLAAGRKRTLWKSLLDKAKDSPRYESAAKELLRWRKQADFAPPFEFFANLLDKDGARKRLLGRLGPDAADGIDEFLNIALTYDDGAPPSLSGFLHAVRQSDREVKRDMEHGKNEVRVMTVHGAKGLEAPIVFLPDTCTTASAKQRGGGIITLPGLGGPGIPNPIIWSIKGASKHRTIGDINEAAREAERHELNRLLYVAMTRARDRLYIAGFSGKNGPAPGCWYDLAKDALAPGAKPSDDPIYRSASEQTGAHESPRYDYDDENVAEEIPAWATAPAPREPQLAIPLAPSRLAPYEIDETGEALPAQPVRDRLTEPNTPSPMPLRRTDAGETRFLRGTLTHALLQHLPSLEKASWPKAAKAFVRARGASLSARAQSSIVAETLGVLEDAKFAPIFSPQSRAEVPIVATIPRLRGKGPSLKITGQIDRLADTGREVLIVDYKTNRPPPDDPAKVADVYLYQLAAYRLAIAEIFPGRTITAALIWTAIPRIMEIPAELLDSFTLKLWDLDTGRLDV